MSTGKLNIWIASQADPCRISEFHGHNPWVVGVWHCCGGIVDWCGQEYLGLRTKCGHIELDLPPGCYVVRGAASMWWTEQGIRGNHWTDHAIVTVCCGKETCVTLFAPSAHNCGLDWLHVVRSLQRERVIPGALAKAALDANQAVVEAVEGNRFDMDARNGMLALLKAADKIRRPKKPPRKGK